MPNFDKSREERSWSINGKAVSRSELLLVTNEDDLLCVYSSEKSFILFDHRCLIHDNSLELAVCHNFSSRFSDGGHDYWFLFNDLLLERLLVLKKHLELFSGEFFYSFDIVAKEVHILLV